MKPKKGIAAIDFMAIIVIIGAICAFAAGIQYCYKMAALMM